MTTHDIAKGDEEALAQLLSEIEKVVREDYWNGEWSQSGARVTYHTSKHRERKP